jgi:hypothetical protein
MAHAGIAVLFMLAPATAGAWENILQDPGFERYHLPPGSPYYVPDANAAWKEFGFGRASVRFDASSWTVPPAMAAEQPAGFTPGANGFEGYGATENSGVMIFDQDISIPGYLQGGALYEAWVWLGGAGLDNETGADFKDEHGGWEIFFFSDPNPANWNTNNTVEYHRSSLQYHGAPNSFVRVSGFGRIPSGAAGFRMRVTAGTWSPPAGGGNYNTRVAVDNAHFALIGAPNLLINGNFEQDITVGAFQGWQRPAVWPFPKNGQNPVINMINVYADNFNHGGFRPYFGGNRAYGYETYVYNAWIDDAFTFSQVAATAAPDNTPMIFTFYWM